MTPAEKAAFIKILKSNKCPAYSNKSKNRGHGDSCETNQQFSDKCLTPALEKILQDVMAR
ncbi:MAG: hypothetical protein WC137_02605 [Alphaproteobacteria bacterium]